MDPLEAGCFVVSNAMGCPACCARPALIEGTVVPSRTHKSHGRSAKFALHAEGRCQVGLAAGK